MPTYQNFVFNGLGTLSFTVATAGAYFLEGKTSLPTLVQGNGASSLLTVVNQNGSPIYTGIAGAEGFYLDVTCAANDVLSVVFSSSAAADQPLNVIKSVVTFGQGQ